VNHFTALQPWTPEDKREYARLAGEVDQAKEALWHATDRLKTWMEQHPTTGWMDRDE